MSAHGLPQPPGLRDVVKLAIQQPYVFPYPGYFQLLTAVDAFVVYDDVTFIKQGWINRNRLRIGGVAHYFSVPIADISSNRLICDVRIAMKEYLAWRVKFLKTVHHNYGKGPYFEPVMALLRRVFSEEPGGIADLARASLTATLEYVGITRRIVASSGIYGNQTLERSQRLFDICHREGASTYYNSLGGAELYSKDEFAAAGLTLRFLKARSLTYPQAGAGPFVPDLSIIDLLMNVSPEQAREWLGLFDLV